MAAAVALVPLARRGWSRPALALFAATSVLLDVDHYVAYVWKTGDLSLWRAYRHHQKPAASSHWGLRLGRPALMVDHRRPLHALAPLAVAAVAAARWPVLFPAAAGAGFHRLQDFLWGCVRVPVLADGRPSGRPLATRTRPAGDPACPLPS